MNRQLVIRQLLRIAVVLAVVIVFWQLFIAHTVVRVNLPNGADGYKLSPVDNTGAGKIKKSGGLSLVGRQTYLVRFYSGNEVIGLQLWKPSALPFGALRSNSDVTTSSSAVPFLGETADYTTPVGTDQYLYINRRSKAVELASSAGIQDLSGSFGLSSVEAARYNMVLSITPTGEGSALVTTTKAVYSYAAPDKITKVSSSATGIDPNFIASAYDLTGKTLLLLNSYDKTVYAYKLGDGTGIQKFYSLEKLPKSISAGGGKAVVYDGDIPTTDKKARAKFAERQQTVPVILDIASKKEAGRLENFVAPSLVLPSGDGRYVLIKNKFTTTVVIHDLTNATDDVTLPAYDVSGAVWVDDTLYVARNNAVWSYAPSDSQASLRKVAETAAPVRRLIASSGMLTLVTTTDISATIDLSGRTQPRVTMANLNSITLTGSDHITSFTALGSSVRSNTQSLEVVRGGELGDQATETLAKIHGAFPGLQQIDTVNKQPFPGYYYYGFIGE